MAEEEEPRSDEIQEFRAPFPMPTDDTDTGRNMARFVAVFDLDDPQLPLAVITGWLGGSMEERTREFMLVYTRIQELFNRDAPQNAEMAIAAFFNHGGFQGIRLFQARHVDIYPNFERYIMAPARTHMFERIFDVMRVCQNAAATGMRHRLRDPRDGSLDPLVALRSMRPMVGLARTFLLDARAFLRDSITANIAYMRNYSDFGRRPRAVNELLVERVYASIRALGICNIYWYTVELGYRVVETENWDTFSRNLAVVQALAMVPSTLASMDAELSDIFSFRPRYQGRRGIRVVEYDVRQSHAYLTWDLGGVNGLEGLFNTVLAFLVPRRRDAVWQLIGLRPKNAESKIFDRASTHNISTKMATTTTTTTNDWQRLNEGLQASADGYLSRAAQRQSKIDTPVPIPFTYAGSTEDIGAPAAKGPRNPRCHHCHSTTDWVHCESCDAPICGESCRQVHASSGDCAHIKSSAFYANYGK